MKKSTITWIVIAVVVLGLFGWGVGKYNGMVTKQISVEQKWSEVEVQYQRRFDLIPNLQATVQGAADFEQETFIAVTEARSAWAKAQGTAGRTDDIAALNSFDSAISRLLVTVENYPQLKATEAFRDFNTSIEGTENRIAQARRKYTEEVKTFNTFIRVFPNSVFAGIFGFEKEAFFDSNEGASEAPKVNFDS